MSTQDFKVNRLSLLQHCLGKAQKVAGKALDNTRRTLFPAEQIRQDIAFARQMLDRAEFHLDKIEGRGESR